MKVSVARVRPSHRPRLDAPLAATMALAAGGCSPADADPAGSVAQAIRGAVTFPNNSGCNAAQQQRVRDVMPLVRTALADDPEPLSACLRDAVTSPSWGHSAEHAVSRPLEDLPTDGPVRERIQPRRRAHHRDLPRGLPVATADVPCHEAPRGG